MNIAQLLKAKGVEPVVVGPDESIGVTARSLAQKKRGLALVCDARRRLLGVVSVIDINRAVAEHGARAPDLPVRLVMTTQFRACRPEDSIGDALRLMGERGVRHLPVLADGVLQGLVSQRMLLEQRLEEAGLQVEEMRGYVLGTGYH